MGTIFVLVVAGIVAYMLWSRARRRGVDEPVHLPGPGTYEFDIVGEASYQGALEQLCGGRTEESAEHFAQAVLLLEDSNPHDNQAVRVDIQGHTVGYLSRKDARSYRAQLRKLGHRRIACWCNAKIVGGWERSRNDRGHFGVKLDLPVA